MSEPTFEVSRTIITVLVAALMAAALGCNSYVGFQFWLTSWDFYFGTPRFLKRFRRPIDLSRRSTLIGVAIGVYLFCGLGAAVLVLLWTEGDWWWLAQLLVFASLLIGINGGLGRYRDIQRLEKRLSGKDSLVQYGENDHVG